MATELEDLTIDEVSAVIGKGRPANQRSKVVLLKTQGSHSEAATMNQVEKVSLARRVLSAIGVRPTELAKTEDDNVTTAELVAKVAELTKANQDLAAKVGTFEKAAQDRATAEKAAVEKAEARKAFRARLPKNLQHGYDEMPDGEKDEFEKRFSAPAGDPVAKALTASAERVEAVSKENAELRARFEKIEDRENRAAIRADLAKVAGLVDVEKTIDVVLALRKTNREQADELVKQLQGGAARLAKGALFSEIGGASAGASDADSALAKATAEVRKANPELSEAQAMRKAMDADPSLYTATLASKEGR